MRTILVPTDFSDTANKARDYAILLADKVNAKIILLNTYYIRYSGPSVATLSNLNKVALEESEKAMSNQLEHLNLNYSNINFKALCKAGLLVDSIKRIGQKMKVDLIVMGTTGASGVIGNWLGSNTSALVDSISIPIIVVPNNAICNFPKHIAVTMELMVLEEEKLIEAITEIGGDSASCIDLLLVVDEDKQQVEDKIKRRNSDFINSKYHPFYFKKGANVAVEILEHIKNKNFDLLAVVSNQRKIWEGLLYKSISNSLVNNATIPLFVLPD